MSHNCQGSFNLQTPWLLRIFPLSFWSCKVPSTVFWEGRIWDTIVRAHSISRCLGCYGYFPFPFGLAESLQPHLPLSSILIIMQRTSTFSILCTCITDGSWWSCIMSRCLLFHLLRVPNLFYFPEFWKYMSVRVPSVFHLHQIWLTIPTLSVQVKTVLPSHGMSRCPSTWWACSSNSGVWTFRLPTWKLRKICVCATPMTPVFWCHTA